MSQLVTSRANAMIGLGSDKNGKKETFANRKVGGLPGRNVRGEARRMKGDWKSDYGR